MDKASKATDFVVLVEGKGYLQPRRKFGPITTARRFSVHESAIKAAHSYARRSKGEWIEVVRVSDKEGR